MPTDFAFRSPSRKLARFFESSRDKWKAKADDRKRLCRKLSNQVRAVEASRAKWRQAAQEARRTAQAAEEELARLRRELDEQKKGALSP